MYQKKYFSGVLAEEELIPFISNKDFNRKDTDLDSLLTDRTAGSIYNFDLFISWNMNERPHVGIINSNECN